MNVKLIKETDAPLLARKELDFELDYAGSRTPTKDEVRKSVASSQKSKEDLVVVKHVYPKFGDCKAKAIVHIYTTAQDLSNYEPKKKEKKSEAGAAPAKKPEGKADAKKES